MTPILSDTPKWILYKHTSSFEIVKHTAIEMHAASQKLSKEDRLALLVALQRKGLYVGRNPEKPLDSIQHRINTLLYYLFGYREISGDSKRFIFSPLGNLFLKHISSEQDLRLIFTSMLWGKQFPDAFFGTSPEFSVYPFRLIFMLMLDPRLGEYITPLEYAHCVAIAKTIDQKAYDEMVEQILEFRGLAVSEIQRIFKANEHHYVNAFHEWQYTTTLLESFGVINVERMSKVFQLMHGKTTKRWLTDDKSRISRDVADLVKALVVDHSPFDSPIPVNDPERLKAEVIKEIYSFCPDALLQKLGHSPSSVEYRLATLPRALAAAALNPDKNSPDEFEDLLTDAMNLFADVEAAKLSGPGNTDIECLYLKSHSKFAVEAKSTQQKLTSLNAGRLALHRSKISARFTLVVTPKYSPSVITDIEGTPNVIVLVNTFTEYLYNAMLGEGGNLSFKPLFELAARFHGQDMSRELSKMTLEKYAVKEIDFEEIA